MHIEPGIVTGAKIALSYVTAAGAGVYAAKLAWQSLRQGGLPSLAGRIPACPPELLAEHGACSENSPSP